MARPVNNKKVAARKAPTNALYRSRIEICRILQVLAREACPIYTEVGEEKLFVSRILMVDGSSGYLAIEYGADKAINSDLFEQPALKFKASYLGAHLVFRVSGPLDMLLAGKPAIRFALPRSLVWSDQRELSRVVIPPHIAVSCVARSADGKMFKANIFDISLDGMGGMVSSGNVKLKVGTALKGCRITYPGGEPIIADLVVRGIKTIAASDGTLYTRASVRFMQRPEEIQALINLFIQDLGHAAS